MNTEVRHVKENKPNAGIKAAVETALTPTRQKLVRAHSVAARRHAAAKICGAPWGLS